MTDSRPADGAQRPFRVAFRGFDQDEVMQRLGALQTELDRLRSEKDSLASRLERAGARDYDFDALAHEIGQILTAAKDAADGLRSRATEEVTTWRTEAQTETHEQRRSAAEDSEAMRTDAWTTSSMLLNQSLELRAEMIGEAEREAATIAERTEREALTLTGETERESHRMLANARREAEEQLRLAKMESERLLTEARAEHDQIVEAANRSAETSQERARALEVRRAEMLEELESVRKTVAKLESDLEEKREALEQSVPEPDEAVASAVTVVTPEGQEERSWSAETIRIIPAEPKPEPEEPVDAAAIADEVRRMRDEAASAAEVAKPEEPEEPEEAADEQPAPDEAPEELEPIAAESEPRSVELDGLFATLRQPSAEQVQPLPTKSAARIETVVDWAPSLPHGLDPMAMRDQLILPITNRILRSVKRQLTESQNIALEEIRVAEGAWDASVGTLVGDLRGDFIILAQESFAAGYVAVESMTGSNPGRAKPTAADIVEQSSDFAAGLLHALEHQTASVDGPRQLSASVSKTYRVWRTDEAERRVRGYARSSYHRGVSRALATVDASRMIWHVAGRGCPECRTIAEHGAVNPGNGFGDDHIVPPAHDECACTIVPGA